MKKSHPPLFLWTGQGWGKTTSAFGAALRALGHNKKVIIIQFMKGRKDIGEYKIQKKLEGLIIKQFGRPGWVNLKNPSEKDKAFAQKALQFAQKAAQTKPFLLILDEINLAAKIDLLEKKEVLWLLASIPSGVHVYLTGRYAPSYLLKKADYVNEIIMKKGPKRLIGEKGIDY